MKKVFILYHDRLYDSCSDNVFSEESFILGIFKSKKEAKKNIGFFQGKPGFSDFPNDFHILELEVDEIYFAEGF